MALEKSITQANGVVSNYHRIDQIMCNKMEDGKFNINVSLSGYINEDYRNKSAYNQVSMNHYSFIVDSAPVNIYDTAYSELKKIDKYIGAVDA